MRTFKNRADKHPRWRAGEMIEGQCGLRWRDYKAFVEHRRKPEPVRVIMKDGVLVDALDKPKTP